jgi:hypothetical protein
MYASSVSYELLTFLAISQPIMTEIVKGVSTNALWDVIKFISLKTWSKVRNRTIKRLPETEEVKRDNRFGLKISLDMNTHLNFELNGSFDEAIIEKSLDKILDFLKEQKLNEKYKYPDYVYFDETIGEWIKIDVMDEIRTKIKAGRI